jgi:radical SAM superfamily enzyme YgiQ (UPF0313 family)
MKRRRLRILLVLADGRIHKLKFGPVNRSFREAPLTATMLAALVPAEMDAQVTIADESVQKIPFAKDFDLVGISCLTGTSTRAYQVADYFRGKGAAVVLGGPHVTLRPVEAAEHADAIVIGFAEQTWPQLLRDFVYDRMKPVYESAVVDLDNLPLPRRDLQKKWGYMVPNTVFATRGCRSICDFCTVPVAKYGWLKRPIGDVIEEIRGIKRRRFVFNDVNIAEEPDYAKELFRALIPLKKIWGGLASTRILEDDELIELMYKSGCVYLLIGFESFNNDSLSFIHKSFNKSENYRELIRKLRAFKIVVMGCFIFGFDDDDGNVFKDTVEMVDDLKIDIPRYAVYTPYPDTPAFKRLEVEGRILHRRWEYYDTQHVVFVPNQMSPHELDTGFKWSYKQTFSLRSNLTRTWGSGKNFPIAFLGNLAYKIYIKRLFSEESRFPEEITYKKLLRGVQGGSFLEKSPPGRRRQNGDVA